MMTRGEDENGSALIMGLFMTMIITTMAAAFLSSSHNNHVAARQSMARDRAFMAAEAGLDAAIVEIRMGIDLGFDGIGNSSGKVNGGTCSAVTTPAFGTGSIYSVRSTGTSDRMSRTLEAVVSVGSRPFGFAVFGGDSVLLNSGAIGDSYDSNLGDYGVAGNQSTNGAVGSNGDITVNSNSQSVMDGMFAMLFEYEVIDPGGGFLEADFNEDTFVDTADLAQWEGDYGVNGDSDANSDGNSDGADFLVWQQQNGQSSLVAASQAVPEPTSMGLLVLALSGWPHFSRRRGPK